MAENNWASLDTKVKKASKRERRERWAETDVSGFWSRWDSPKWYGDKDVAGADNQQVARLTHAASAVLNFVNALSGDSEPWTVGISSSIDTAATDFGSRHVTLAASVILDPTLTEAEASSLMIKYTAHEIGHILVDEKLVRALDESLNALTPGLDQFTAKPLANLLREARVERGFDQRFPGFGGGWNGMLRYISRGVPDGSEPPHDPITLVTAATRYPFRFDWDGQEDERDWWTAWIARWQDRDDWDGHREGLVEGCKRIAILDEVDRPRREAEMKAQDEARQATTQARNDAFRQAQAEKNTARDQYDARRAEIADKYRNDYSDFLNHKIDVDQYRERNSEERKESRDALIEYRKAAEKANRKAGTIKAQATRKAKAADKTERKSELPVSIEDVADILAGERARNQATRRRMTPEQAQAERERRDSEEKRNASVQQANLELGSGTDGRQADVPKIGELRGGTDHRVDPDLQASAIFRTAFLRARVSEAARMHNMRSGRLDHRNMHRLANRNDDRLFTRRGAESRGGLRIMVMADVSGSMLPAWTRALGPDHQPLGQEAGLTAALAAAVQGLPRTTLTLYGWSTDVTPVLGPGSDPALAGNLFRTEHGGTNDSGCLRWASRELNRTRQPDEKGLILMLSDGQGQGMAALRRSVEAVRSLGQIVVGVAVGEVDLSPAYGRESWVKWQGSVLETAEPLARVITKAYKEAMG